MIPGEKERFQREQQAQKVVQWRECLTRLPDNLFFELIRMYLGEIKTPYNKQNLIERLGAFLHKEQVQQNILLLLSPTDCQLLSAIFYLEHPTHKLLAQFFADTFSPLQLKESLMNLEERLLIFRNTSNLLPKEQPAFFLNPILESSLQQRLHPSLLLPLPQEFQNQVEGKPLPQLSANLLATFYSFIKEYPDVCRQDGTIKKRAIQRLSLIFPFQFTEDIALFFQTLIMGLKNLSLLKENEKGFEPDFQRWTAFAQLPAHLQEAYLVAAACGRDTKAKLQQKAGIFLSMANLCPPEGFTQDAFLRLEFLIQYMNPENLKLTQKASPQSESTKASSEGILSGTRAGTSSRFARMMAEAEKNRQVKASQASENKLQEKTEQKGSKTSAPEAEAQEAKPQEQEGELFPPPSQEQELLWCKTLFEAATKLGLLRPTGTGYGVKNTLQTVYHPQLSKENSPVPEKGHITMDSALTATLLPGLSLEQILPLMQFLRVSRFDTAMTLEITKDSSLHGFDQGLHPNTIQELLSRYTRHHLPQSLSVSLEDWYHSYNVATLYKGYILHLKEKKDISQHPVLAKHIVLQLEEGIYLMNFTSDQEAQEILSKGGFDNAGSIKEAPQHKVLLGFASNLRELSGSQFLHSSEFASFNWQQQQELQHNHLQQLEAQLEQQDLPPHQREGLQFRINRRILLIPEQLQGSSVKMEQYEATGMDFVGKVHVADQAIHQGNLLKLTYLQQDKETQVVVGRPIEIQKIQGDSLIVLEIEQKQATFSLGQAQQVRRIQGSIFASEPTFF
ncbi:MAG: hypothetical protein U0I22_08670 [Treponema sp.]|nr:hypothetical protein [Treponema sp.]